MRAAATQRTTLIVYTAIFLLVLAWSAIDPFDRLTWALEVAPAVIGFAILAATWRRFPLTPLLYFLILVHAVILVVGGHYTYAEVPGFRFDIALLGGERNQYDKLGHFAQGFVPAMVARELMLRLGIVARVGWVPFLALCVVLAISAFYELIEWWVALLAGMDSEAFLGTQGFEWDTQSDMGLALFGGVVALVALSRLHDRQLERLTGPQGGGQVSEGGTGFC
jgi:putative membrane protein